MDAPRALLGWVVFIVLLSAAGLASAPRDTGAFVLSALMLGVGMLCGAVLVAALRMGRR
ncbi:hypothetical protein K1W54_06510 [Micromonospora sp. CPCC 205371]|nr:hypothetical protein [Micromonospora sp. CPCC 205371]